MEVWFYLRISVFQYGRNFFNTQVKLYACAFINDSNGYWPIVSVAYGDLIN